MTPIKNKPIKLIVKNFGPIENVDLTLGDFTVIIGPNSSGKTFIVNLLNSLMTFVSNYSSFHVMNKIFNSIEKLLIKNDDKKYPINISMSEYPEEIINNIIEDITAPLSEENNNQIDISNNLKSQIFQYFQVPLTDLIQFGKTEASIEATFLQMKVSIKIDLNTQNPDIKISLNKEFLKDYIKGFKATYFGKSAGSYGSPFQNILFQNIIIPTERLSILETMPNIINDLAKYRGQQTLFMSGFQNQQKQDSKLSLIEFMSKYLEAIQLLATNKKDISKNAIDLINGNLSLDMKVPGFFNLRINDNNVPLLLISSGTLQLIPLIILAESPSNQTLIIEEPEINLHANKQVEVADYLWNLVEEKNKTIFVSTHSDYFTVRLAHLSRDNQNKKVKIYLLNEGHAKPLKIDKNGELDEIETIGDVMNKLLLEK